MRKIVLIAISFLLLACSTISLKNLQALPTAQPVNPLVPTLNETLISQIVQATVLAGPKNLPLDLQQTPAPVTGCPLVICPTCAAAEVNSPIFPAPPTVSVPGGKADNNPVPKSADATTPVPTSTPAKPYQPQSSSPVYLTNFSHQAQGCNWMGVAGQIFDLSGNPSKNMVIMVEGKLNGANVNGIGLTGMTNLYGPGGFEIVLGSKPVASSGTMTLTVYGLNGIALSDPIPFNTNGDCQKNLILINFNQVR